MNNKVAKARRPPQQFVGGGTHGQGSLDRADNYTLAALFVCAALTVDLHSSIRVIGTNPGTILLVGVTGALVVSRLLNPSASRSRPQILVHDWAYLVSIGVMLTSATWSISPSATLLAALPLVILWIATYLLSDVPIEVAVRLVTLFAILVAIASLAAVPLVGDMAFQGAGSVELRGIYQHQLRLGALMALALGLLFVAKLNGDLDRIFGRSRSWFVLIILLLAAVMLLSRTRLYVGAAIIALLLTVALSRRGFRKWVALWVIALVAYPVYSGFSTFLNYLDESGFDTGLTGRTLIWTRTSSAVTEDTELRGFGFGTFKLPEFDHLFSEFYRPEHAHNSFLQAYFETGVLGFTALIILVVAQMYVAWRYSVLSNRYSYSLFLVMFTTIGSLTGLNYAGTLSAMICITMLFLAIESRALTITPNTATNVARNRRKSPQVVSKRAGEGRAGT